MQVFHDSIEQFGFGSARRALLEVRGIPSDSGLGQSHSHELRSWLARAGLGCSTGIAMGVGTAHKLPARRPAVSISVSPRVLCAASGLAGSHALYSL